MTGEEIVFLRYDGGEVKHPKTDKEVAAKAPYGAAKEAPGEERSACAFC